MLLQMEWFNCKVDDRSKVVGGAQKLETSDGYVITLSIESGLAYMHPMIPTDNDLQNYPHVFFTSPDTWDASVEEDWKSLRPYFGWQSEQVIQDTYKVTSRFEGTIPHSDYLNKHFKSRNPVFNICRRNCWKPSSPFSNMHFRNTTKIAAQVLCS